MGAVYRASDEHLHIPVAVKENLFLTEEYGRQFQREAHILAGLRHSNLPHVTDYFSMENQVQYLVMDFVEGEDLRQRMERMGSLPERETMLIGISICEALNYLHTRRPPIVHRDIKPGNIKVTPDGQAVLVDFGLAKIMQGSQATSTGARAMTPGYSPPEQYGTARTDPRSDIYSLGATLYAALTGVIPEDGLARMTGRAKLTPLRELNSKLNRRLADCIERALEVDPDDRYQTAEEFKHSLIDSGELAPFYQEPPSIAPPPSEEADSVQNGVLKEEEEVLSSSPSWPSSAWRRNSRRRRILKRWRYPIIVSVILTGALLFTLFGGQPSIASTLFASNPSATAPIESTSVLAMNTSPAAVEGQTPDPSQSDPATPGPSPTYTPEPTSTPSPTTTQTPTPSPTALGGGYSQVAFASDMAEDFEIWLVDANSTRPSPRQLTNMADGSCQPAWSPDGMTLAFVSPCRGKYKQYPGSRIYTINVDGSGLRELTNSVEGDFDPAWSPDSKKIAFTSLRSGRAAIWVLNLEDGKTVEISGSNYADRQPAWSPDGKQIAFIREMGTSQVWIMNANGDIQKQFSRSVNMQNQYPAWSVDGSMIFFSQTSSDSAPVLKFQRLEDIDKENGNEKRIPQNLQGRAGPYDDVAPSPDGNWLAYENWYDGKSHEIYIMNINGADQQLLTSNKAYDFGAAWRPLTPQP